MNPKQKYIAGLGGGGSFGTPDFSQLSMSKPMLPGLGGGEVTANAGATSVAPAPIAKPAQNSPQQQYTQSLSPDTSSMGSPSIAPQISPFQGVSTSQAPKTDPNASYRAAFDSYLQSLAPSSAETAATENLRNLTLQSKRDYEKALESGETLGFASGEAARVNRNNSFGIEAAANAVDSFTGQRSAMTEAQKARLDFEKSLLPKEEAFTLGAGDVRYDAQGNKIAEGGVKPPTLPASAQEYEFAKSQGYKGSYDQYQTEDANRKRSIVNINAAGLTPQMTNTALKLSDDYEQRSKDYYTVRDSYNRIQAASENPSAAGDMALLFSYMKILDPNSVVRETEYATAQNAGSIPERTRAAYNAAVNGQKLSEAQRKDFVNRAGTIFETAKKQQDSIAKEFTQRASQYGVPSNLVVRDTVATGAPTSKETTTGNNNPLGI